MQKKANRYFIPIDGMPIEVSEEVYRAYYRPIWNTRYHAQKNGECRCTKAQIWKCDGVCPGCPFYAAGKKVSLDTAIGGEDDDLTLGDTLADDAPTADSILMDEELLKALYDELDRLDPEGKRICALMMHHSEREAAEIMGMARSTFKRHWAKSVRCSRTDSKAITSNIFHHPFGCEIAVEGINLFSAKCGPLRQLPSSGY